MLRSEFLQSFALVIEHGSFAGAARQLNITPAAVAKQIGLLEQSVGFQLLNRSTRALSLTEEGVAFHAQFLRIIEEMKEAESLSSALKGQPEGRLKVASSVDFGEKFFVPHLPEFLAMYPNLALEIELSDSIPDFEKEKIDILIGFILGVPDHIIQRKIIDTQYVLCASPDYLKAYGTPKRPEDISTHKILNHSKRRPSPKVLWFDNDVKIMVEPYLLMNLTRSLLLAAKSGLGIVYLHQYVVEDALLDGSLIQLLEEYTTKNFPIYYFYKPTRYPLPKISAFTQFFMQKIKAQKDKLT